MAEIRQDEIATGPEDLFVGLFAQVFGLEKTHLLSYQHPFQDIYGGNREIDYAIRTVTEKVAFEIDGLIWHVPSPDDAESIRKYEDDLFRQNSLIHQGWRVFRWTDRQIADEPEQIKDQLALFLERIPGLLEFDEFLPKQHGALLTLREHQEDALEAISELRGKGITIALLAHATGTGKTVTAIADAQRLGGRTLFIVHTKDLVHQSVAKFEEMWPGISVGRFVDIVHDTDEHVIVGTVQSVSKNLPMFKPDDFNYLIIDEAHHATADTYQHILKYFHPEFTLGLSATEDRADGISALEVFRNAAHRLSLREAVENGELVPIRCVRVETNIDLTKVRFNEVQYNRRDIEEAILVPGRDQLILDTYVEHVLGRKAVVFCVNVRHGETLANLFQCQNISARSVSGRLPAKERARILADFASGSIRVLCACDLLNEGWDCADIEVLFMARPTLSKVIYLQQLGRGTRRAPGKESLIVFDFVDNASKYNSSLSLHRILGNKRYRKGELILGNAAAMEAEQKALESGQIPTQTLPVSLWATDYREIDVFNWQESVKGMISSSDLEIELATTEGKIREAAIRGTVTADHVLELGERTYFYFQRDRAEEIRQELDLPRVDDNSIRDLFLVFVERMDMAASYKPVMLNAILELADAQGRARLDDVSRAFLDFYLQRLQAGLPVERSNSKMANPDQASLEFTRNLMLTTPFRKFEQRKFLLHDRQDLAFIKFTPSLWRQLVPEDLCAIKSKCESKIVEYYERLPSK
jgi:superfamily II DNA or RNA helicase/very-short-patch-repair endonuclease